MDSKKITLIMVLPLLFLLCGKKNPSSSGPALTSASLQGTWYLSSTTREVFITTNSDQTALDILGSVPGTGYLTVTGAYPATLTRLAYVLGYLISASSHGYNNTTVYPNYQLGIANIIILKGASFTVNLDASNSIEFSTIDIDTSYTFDTTAYQLSVTNMVLWNANQTASVTVNGILGTAKINVPAYSQTRILSITDDDPDTVILVLNADSTSLLVSAAGETSRGTWLLEGSVLTAIDDQQPPDTLEWQVGFYGSTMTVKRDSAHCTAPACDYSTLEANYRLQSGSVIDAMTRIKHTFSR